MWPGIAAAPKGVRLDSPEAIKLHARMIAINAVDSHAMPPGNITALTPEDRQVHAARNPERHDGPSHGILDSGPDANAPSRNDDKVPKTCQ